mgnify:CR=1 FL=1
MTLAALPAHWALHGDPSGYIARSESPELVAELQEEVIDVLKAGKEACRDVRSALESQRSDPQKEIEFFLMWMKEAVLTREQAKADPKRGGVPLEQILKAIGMTVDSLRQLRVFRSQILLDKLAKTEFPDESLLTEIKADREAVMAEVGPRRRRGWPVPLAGLRCASRSGDGVSSG